MLFLKVPTSQLTSSTLKPKWIINELFSQPGTCNFDGCILPISDSVICHTCATANLKGLLHLDTRSESSFLSNGFRNWKNALCKTKGFCKHESSICHKHAVTMVTQPGHIDEQLKERLKSQKEENRKSFLKIAQSISYLYHHGMDFCKGKQDVKSNFKQLFLLLAQYDGVLRKWIEKSYNKHMVLNA